MAISPEVLAAVAPLKAELEKVNAQNAELMKSKRGNPDGRTPKASEAFGEPFVRKGESPLTSRGFQFQRVLGVRGGILSKEHAKVEMEVHEMCRKRYVVEGGFKLASDPIITQSGVMLAPLGSELMGGVEESDHEFAMQMKSMTCAGVGERLDRDEMEWIARKSYRGTTKANQSWLDETLGGSLVAPPEFGELIQLLRNKDAMINAGVRVVPLPPSGRIKYPRQTSPTTGYWVGENTAITASNFGTGTLLLSAKKCAAIVTMPNELIRFASPASEALLRADMTKTLSLTFDKACLEGIGSDTQPLGVLLTPNINTIAPTQAVSGNTGAVLSPQDVYKFIGTIEAQNAEFQGWIMRPELFYYLVGARSTSGGNTGPFTFDQFRQLGMGFPKILAGYPVTTTSQVSSTIAVGNTNTSTYVLGGQWDDALMALFGTIEFAQAFQGDTAFADDQVVVRAILTGDFGLRHAAAFAACNQLQFAYGA